MANTTVRRVRHVLAFARGVSLVRKQTYYGSMCIPTTSFRTGTSTYPSFIRSFARRCYFATAYLSVLSCGRQNNREFYKIEGYIKQ